ncbi:MAG: RluA family pseudouridine synthase [Betaproteobacteria bacterium]|nr:RluA family pseudouridine synthase [Betaproteobacteria bacterium]
MKDLFNVSVSVVGPEGEDQRVDNFLMRHCKGVPRSHIYRILRTGEVRVNSCRVDATHRLAEGDRIRIPPIRVAAPSLKPYIPVNDLPIVLEDDALLVVNKPAGLAVHGGSGISFGVIEQMRAARPKLRFLELVHRLDRDTSGLLLLAKKRSALTALHEQMRDGAIHKSYLALVPGNWGRRERNLTFPLRKYLTKDGERRVSVDSGGQAARTIVCLVRRYEDFSLVSAELMTGRTHQIRVHLAHLGFPIAGDDKYGTFEVNRNLAGRGLKRMFLHAAELKFFHPLTGIDTMLMVQLPPELQRFLGALKELSDAGAWHP